MSVSAAVMCAPTESPATAIRLGSKWMKDPSRTIHWAAAYPCSSETGVVCEEDDNGAGADSELRDESVLRGGVAEHPAAAMHVEDHRQRPDGVRGPDDPHAHVAEIGGHGSPAVVPGQPVGRRGPDNRHPRA